ncbi:hypothetical protein ACIRU8_10300 [Streptomyces sp. NPDC101175]|uniref:hypothetical protein n=1 Tax=Streptomyces sp. NPDC101175 TaxID=3366123 RepID=UPI003839C355
MTTPTTGRRLIAAGFIRKTGRTLTFDARGPRVTATLTRTAEALTVERDRDPAGSACGNRWKYGKDTCARDAQHIGPHRNTAAREAWSFHWFDSEGTPAVTA